MTKIERVEVLVTDLADRMQRQTSGGTVDTGAHGNVLGKPVMVRIWTDDGAVGTGQIRPVGPSHFAPESSRSVYWALRDIYAPALIGRSIFAAEEIWEHFDRTLPGNPAARSVVDCALLDTMGRRLGVPVYELLGGLCQRRIPLEWSVAMADDPQAVVDDALQAIDVLKMSALCLKAGGPGGWRTDVRNFEAVRGAVGKDVSIAIDPNTAWSVPDTLNVIERLVDLDVAYVEQPIDRRDISGLALLRRAGRGVAIAADESVFTRRDAFDLARADAVDILCLKLYKNGGIREARRIAEFADTANLKVALGGLAIQSQLEAAASAHLFSSIPARLLVSGAEFIFGVGVGAADPLVSETDFLISDGHADVPSGPGLGVTIDENALKKQTIVSEVIS